MEGSGHRGTREPPDGDDRERRDDHMDQSYQGISHALNGIVSREAEAYDRRVRQENEQYSLRQTNREHHATLERTQLTEELGRRSKDADLTFRDRLAHSTPTAAIEEENAENVTDAPDTGTELPKA